MPRCVDGERSLLPLTICPTPQALKEVLKLLGEPAVSWKINVFIFTKFLKYALSVRLLDFVIMFWSYHKARLLNFCDLVGCKQI